MSDKNSLIELSHFSKKNIVDLFQKCIQLKKNFQQSQMSDSGLKGIAVLLFLEPSTRTRFSFEAACARAGIHPLVLTGGAGTSLEKGETLEDTILNLAALRPLFFVIRCSDDLDLNHLQRQISVPLLNAGWGMRGHPTQALLDGVTLFERWGAFEDKKILFVGDIKHSRVLSSHLELALILNYKIGYCAPPDLIPEKINILKNKNNIQCFDDLELGLQWADAVVGLRVQKERHIDLNHENKFTFKYHEKFSLNLKKLKHLKKEGLILHPGPINYGVEFEKDVLTDPRSVVLQLVENGAFLREVLIREIIKTRKTSS